MSDSFRVDVPNMDAFIARYRNAPRIVGEEMAKAAHEAGTLVERGAKARVGVKTGTLRRSIATKVTTAALFSTATVGTNVPYARAHHFGRRGITARGRALRFEVGGQVIFRKSVGPAKANPFLYQALQAARPGIVHIFDLHQRAAIARITGGR